MRLKTRTLSICLLAIGLQSARAEHHLQPVDGRIGDAWNSTWSYLQSLTRSDSSRGRQILALLKDSLAGQTFVAISVPNEEEAVVYFAATLRSPEPLEPIEKVPEIHGSKTINRQLAEKLNALWMDELYLTRYVRDSENQISTDGSRCFVGASSLDHSHRYFMGDFHLPNDMELKWMLELSEHLVDYISTSSKEEETEALKKIELLCEVTILKQKSAAKN